jgi:putative acetyltransferase
MTTIRRFEITDARATHEVFIEAVLIGAAGRYSEAERQEWVPETDMPDDWGEWLEEHVTLVAQAGDRITGFMMVERDGYLHMAFVRPDRMGTGLADQLYQALLVEVRALGLARLTTLASRYSESFFRRHGWQFAPEFTSREGYDPRQGPHDNPTTRPLALDPVPQK